MPLPRCIGAKAGVARPTVRQVASGRSPSVRLSVVYLAMVALPSAWLKNLENMSGRLADSTDPMATYDFTWLWRELGVEGNRR